MITWHGRICRKGLLNTGLRFLNSGKVIYNFHNGASFIILGINNDKLHDQNQSQNQVRGTAGQVCDLP